MRCPHCGDHHHAKHRHQKGTSAVQKHGHYRRKSDSRFIQRYFCHQCQRTFSLAIHDPAYRQKKRRINHPLKVLLASSVSMRRAAKILGVSRHTVAKRLPFLAQLCRDRHAQFLDQSPAIRHLQLDELHTIDHTKLKPLAVAVAVCAKGRKILGVEVSSMPATGPLATKSRQKYGPRPDRRRQGLQQLLARLVSHVDHHAKIDTDSHPYYPALISRYFPQSAYRQVLGKKAAVAGQEQVQNKGHDPLFVINHTMAMLRANINRLVRRTWCTTKDPTRLADHLAIYMSVHNQMLTA